jgi:Holliday junction resolvasome RuvABC endonuclease subunit
LRGYSFDLGKRTTGVAIWEHGNLALVDEVSFQEHDYFGDVLIAFDEWVRGQVFVRLPAWVAYEEVMTRNKLHAEQHFGMVAVLAMWCARRSIPLLGINTMKLKKHVAGKGNCTKEEMLAAVRERYPEVEVPGHDAADAVAAGVYAQSMFMSDHE